jgi:hypothetical protein
MALTPAGLEPIKPQVLHPRFALMGTISGTTCVSPNLKLDTIRVGSYN